MIELLGYEFARNALLSMVFLSVLAGVVGTYIVVRRMVFAAGGITHASFGGIGLAYYFGLNPTVGALVFAMATALGVDVLSRRGNIREDSAIAMLWSLGMAVGVIFMSLTPGYAPNLMGFMFGDVLAVGFGDVVAIGVVAVLAVALAVVFYRPLLYASFDQPFAKLVGWRVEIVSVVASVMMALSISLAIKSVGIILVLSVFTVPQTIAGLYARSMGRIMVLSSVVALVGCLGGLALSFVFDLPAGAVITALLCLSLLVVKLVRLSQF